MRLGLRTRFILIISAVLLGIFAITAYFLIRNVRISSVNDLNRESKAFASLATSPVGATYNLYQNSGIVKVQLQVQQFMDLDSNVVNVAIVGLDGQVLFQQNNSTKFAVGSASVSTFDPSYITNGSNLITQIVEPYFNDAEQHPYSVVYAISNTELVQNIGRQELDIFIFSLIGLIVSAGATYEMIRRLFLVPVERVSRLALVVSSGHYEQQISASRNDEIGDLARSVNDMAEKLSGDIKKLQEVDRLKNEFIMITSHNLRTPLSIIKGNVEMLKQSRMSKSTTEMIDAIEQSSRTLAIFSEDMLTISSIEDGSAVMSLHETSVKSLLAGMQDEFTNLANLRKIKLNWQVDNPLQTLMASEVHLRGALRNLLDNAMKFTEAGGTVSLQVHYDAGQTIFVVTDSGIGISPDELPKLFTKFHRGTSTLTYNYAGTGIGLYAAKLVVDAHHGQITVQTELGKGSSFTITLPSTAADTTLKLAK